jgi:DNA-binding IclR family transcriptional regulator
MWAKFGPSQELHMKKKKKPTVIDKAIILLKDIRKNGEGRTLALSKKYGFHRATVSRILINLAKQGILDKKADGSFGIADEWRLKP